jgi:arylsulfatase A-like enzyme
VRPNIVLVVLDTARADAFEPYGAAVGSTPTVASLARDGVAMTAYSPANWTVPAHASLFTGLLPREVGLTQVRGGDRDRCRASMTAVAGRNLVPWLRSQGWSTRAVSANPWISPQSGFDVGFDEFVVVAPSRRALGHDGALSTRLGWAASALLARADDGARRVEQVLNGWAFDVDPGRPFFWFVNLLECHAPYLPPRPYARGAWQRLLAADDARRYLSLETVFRVCAGNVAVPPAALARMRLLYRQSVRLVDDWLDRLLTTLDAAGVLPDTQIIVTSDHGENLGDGGLLGHAFSLDERLVRVPFVTAGPLPVEDDGLLLLSDVPAWLTESLAIAGTPWSRRKRRDQFVAPQ